MPERGPINSMRSPCRLWTEARPTDSPSSPIAWATLTRRCWWGRPDPADIPSGVTMEIGVSP